MDLAVWKNNLKAVKSQRNFGLLLNIFLSLIIILCLLIIYKRSNQHSTIIIPAGITSPVNISNNGVDNAYITQWAEFIASLKLNVTPETIAKKQNILLEHVSSHKYGAFKEHLIKEIERVKQDELSMVFFPKDIKVLDDKNTDVKISGMLKVFIGDEINQTLDVSYRLKFTFENGKLFLDEFKEISRV